MVIPPQLISLAIQLGMQGINMATQGMNAKKQEKQGRDMSNSYKRPTYDTPQAIKENTQNMRMAYQNPNLQGYDKLNNQQLSNQASTMRAIRESGLGGGSVHAALAGINDNANKAEQDMQIAQNQQKNAALGGLGGALATEANYQDKMFDYNKNQPYQNAQATAAAQIAASMKQKDVMGASANAGINGLGQQFLEFSKNPDFLKALQNPKFMEMLKGLGTKKSKNMGAAMPTMNVGGQGITDKTNSKFGNLANAQELTNLGQNAATIPSVSPLQSPQGLGDLTELMKLFGSMK